MSFRLQCYRTFVLALIACVPAWSQGQELRYKFQAGGKSAYVTEIKQTLKMDVNGKATEIKLDLLFETTQTVDSVDTATGIAKLNYKFDRMKVVIDGPINMEYDSKNDKEPDSPLAATFKALSEGEIKMTMNLRGELTDIIMPEKLIEELKKQSSSNSELFGNLFSDDAFKDMINQSAMILPREAPIAGKSTWERNLDKKMGTQGVLKNTTKYTYAGKSESFDKIVMKMDMKLEADPNAVVKISMKTKDAAGTILFDNEKGRVQEINSNVVSELNIEPVGPVSLIQTMTMKVK